MRPGRPDAAGRGGPAPHPEGRGGLRHRGHRHRRRAPRAPGRAHGDQRRRRRGARARRDIGKDVPAGGTVVIDFTAAGPGPVRGRARAAQAGAHPRSRSADRWERARPGAGARRQRPVRPPGAAAGGAARRGFAVRRHLRRPRRLLAHAQAARATAAGSCFPTALQRLLDSRGPAGVARGLVARRRAVLVVFVALFGPTETSFNLAPYAFYVTFWVGLVPASLLLGPVWRAVNPLRMIAAGCARADRAAAGCRRRCRGSGCGRRPAFLVAYAWAGAGLPRPGGAAAPRHAARRRTPSCSSSPRSGTARTGSPRGDGFEVYSTLLGRLQPARPARPTGCWVLRNPLDGADGTALVAGPRRRSSPRWSARPASTGSPAPPGTRTGSSTSGTEVLLPTVGLLLDRRSPSAALYAAATSARRARWTGIRGAPALFAHSVVPIAAGYAIAHYFSLLFFEGQLTWILSSNPFGRTAWTCFGTLPQHGRPDACCRRTRSRVVQVGAIVLGHVLGVVLAHDRAVRLSGRGRRRPRARSTRCCCSWSGSPSAALGLLLGLTLTLARRVLGREPRWPGPSPPAPPPAGRPGRAGSCRRRRAARRRGRAWRGRRRTRPPSGPRRWWRRCCRRRWSARGTRT